MVPLRVEGSAFAATLNGTVVSPCPCVEPPSWIQLPAAAAVHWHSRAVDTVSVPSPPAAENEVGVAVAVMPHFIAEGDVTLSFADEHAPIDAQSASAGIIRCIVVFRPGETIYLLYKKDSVRL